MKAIEQFFTLTEGFFFQPFEMERFFLILNFRIVRNNILSSTKSKAQ